MAVRNTSVLGIFRDQMSVANAVEHLQQSGFHSSDVAVLLADNQGNQDFAHQKESKGPEGATTGGITGAILGGALGWLAGIGAIAIPGAGMFIAAGPIMAIMAGIGAGTTICGLAGGLIGLGIPEYEAKRYAGMIKDGKALLSAHCRTHDAIAKAKAVMTACGGTHIAARTEARAPADERDAAAQSAARAVTAQYNDVKTRSENRAAAALRGP